MNRSLTRPLPALAALAAVLVLSACTGEQGGATKTTGEPSVQAGDSAVAAAQSGTQSGTQRGAQDSSQGMQGMQGMAGMAGMAGASMMGQMQAHMRMMETGNADSLKAMLPMHRQMTANMISEFNREMKSMNMAADSPWSATMDSLRQDLVRMPEMSAAELKSFMPAHRTRMTRLMESHRAMMKNMGM